MRSGDEVDDVGNSALNWAKRYRKYITLAHTIIQDRFHVLVHHANHNKGCPGWSHHQHFVCSHLKVNIKPILNCKIAFCVILNCRSLCALIDKFGKYKTERVEQGESDVKECPFSRIFGFFFFRCFFGDYYVRLLLLFFRFFVNDFDFLRAIQGNRAWRIY